MLLENNLDYDTTVNNFNPFYIFYCKNISFYLMAYVTFFFFFGQMAYIIIMPCTGINIIFFVTDENISSLHQVCSYKVKVHGL